MILAVKIEIKSWPDTDKKKKQTSNPIMKVLSFPLHVGEEEAVLLVTC